MADAGSVEVVYALPDVQVVIGVPHSPELTAERAVELSGLAERFPEIRTRPLVLGIFGERVPPDRAVAPGERVEVCRPLLRSPRERRRDHAVKRPG